MHSPPPSASPLATATRAWTQTNSKPDLTARLKPHLSPHVPMYVSRLLYTTLCAVRSLWHCTRTKLYICCACSHGGDWYSLWRLNALLRINMNPISVPVTTKQRPRTTVLASSETCPPPKTPHEALYFFLAECTTSMILSTTEGSDNCASVSSVYSGLCTIDASPPHALKTNKQ